MEYVVKNEWITRNTSNAKPYYLKPVNRVLFPDGLFGANPARFSTPQEAQSAINFIKSHENNHHWTNYLTIVPMNS